MPFNKHITRKNVECKGCRKILKVGEVVYARLAGSKRHPSIMVLGDYCKDCRTTFPEGA